MTKNKYLVKEYFELQAKKDKVLKMPWNFLTKSYIKSLGKSELEKMLNKQYENFTFMEFLNKTEK